MLSGLPLLVLWRRKHLILSCLSMGSHFSKDRNKISHGPWDLDSLVSSPLRPSCVLFWPLTSSLLPLYLPRDSGLSCRALALRSLSQFLPGHVCPAYFTLRTSGLAAYLNSMNREVWRATVLGIQNWTTLE